MIEEFYQSYRDIADIRIVYINESHPSESLNKNSFAIEKDLSIHRTWDDRRDAAKMMLDEKKMTVPCLIDNMDNLADLKYNAWPDKVFLIRTDGKLGFVAADGPNGFSPGVELVRGWLDSFRETGEQTLIASQGFDAFKIIVANELVPHGNQALLLADLDEARKVMKAQKEEASKGPRKVRRFKHEATRPDSDAVSESTSPPKNVVSTEEKFVPGEIQIAETTKRIRRTIALLVGFVCISGIVSFFYCKHQKSLVNDQSLVNVKT